MNRAPNAIAIGAGKAGSTSLHNYLNEHPHIFGSKEKELMYFTSRFDRGVEWYKSNFPVQDGVKIYFETTPQYTFRDEIAGVPERIFEFDPDMKLMYIVREPLSRIVSHFNHWNRTQPHKYKDLERSLATPAHRKKFVDRTLYFHQLKAYLDVFPKEQIKVIFLEDFKVDFGGTLNTIYDFLGADQIGGTMPPSNYNASDKAWTVSDLSDERRGELTRYLGQDVQDLLAYCGKPKDFWGDAYL